MWYRDLDGTPDENVKAIAAFFDCSDEAAENILAETAVRHALGDSGHAYGARSEIHGYDLSVTDSYKLLRGIEKSLGTPLAVDRFEGVDTHDLAQLFHDAWIEGIQRKDRVTVKLDNSTCDAVCTDCGRCLSNGAEECEHCGSVAIDHQVLVTVSDPFAELWADCDQTIDGSSWESVGNGDVYTILSVRPGLVEELESEGYKLDLSDYSGE